MKNQRTNDAFETLRSARPASPLMTDADVLSAMARSSQRPVAEYSRGRGVIIAAAALGCIAASVILLRQPEGAGTAAPTQPEAPTQAASHIAAPAATSPSLSVAPPITHQRRTAHHHHASVQQQAAVPETHEDVSRRKASIAGLQFLDLTDDEFSALPPELLPDVRTFRSRTVDGKGTVHERHSLECLSADQSASATVIDNGIEYVQVQAMYIPVRRIDQSAQRRVERVAWYRPSGSLIALLPERYRVPIMIEMNLLSEVQRGCITPSEACRSLPHGQSYFDMCRLDAARIKDLSITRPSGSRTASCSVDLRYQASVRLAAFNPSGAYVAELSDPVSLDPGEHTITFSVDGLAPGLYLISATTQDGEHVVRRMIVD